MSALWETAWLGDLPAAVLAPAGQFYVAPDHLGSPHQITDSSGAVVWLWHPDPFGNGDPSGAFSYELRFPGQYFDQATRLHYNYFRDYDPRTGRYIESDPIGLAGGINTYGYVLNDPVNRTDPLGLAAGLTPDGGTGGTTTGTQPCAAGGRGRLNKCLNACAAGGAVLEKFCRSLPDPRARAGCWAVVYAGEVACRGWCFLEFSD